jgi:hypothetical protein
LLATPFYRWELFRLMLFRFVEGSLRRSSISGLLLVAALGLVSCGRPPLTGGRPYPPDFDGYGYPRAMVAWASGGNGSGTLQLIDVEHDTVNNKQDTVHSYTISGYSGSDPQTIQDFPGQQVAYVFANGGGATGTPSFQPVNTGTDTGSTPVGGIAVGTTSVYVTQDFSYVYSVSPTATSGSVGFLSVYRATDGSTTRIPLPGASKLAESPPAFSFFLPMPAPTPTRCINLWGSARTASMTARSS